MYLGRAENRWGASLLEVLIATSILLVAVAALSTRAQIGLRAANRTQLQAMATAICQSILDEHVASGTLNTTSASRVPGFDDWMYQSRLETLNDQRSLIGGNDKGHLTLYSATVWQPGRNESRSKLTLSRIVRLPDVLSPNLRNLQGMR